MRLSCLFVFLILATMLQLSPAFTPLSRATRRYGESKGKVEQKKVVHYETHDEKQIPEFSHHMNFLLDQPFLALVPVVEPKKTKKPRTTKHTKTRSRMSFVGL
ncbi:hypothetical protein QR680_010123 [Steinernema hermaphroditum]|uniref:Uncharacterized protein n=1 Tax=Steinernema hermaphroditum TaxID=289476 RepID=A0AA39IP67_9BILA|nr:hypothetical protein QR680_010123 [Steinernema hermaphroditum]